MMRRSPRLAAVACSIIALAALGGAACGSDPETMPADDAGSAKPDAGSSSGSSGSNGSSGSSGADPCVPLANATNLSGCVPMYCECADGTSTTVGGGCSNGVGTANCTFGCAQHGGSGTPKPVENVYSSAECVSYCRTLYALGCSSAAFTSFESSISSLCSFIRTTPDAGAIGDAGPDAPTTCAEAVKRDLACIVSTADYKCNGSGFSGPTSCAQSEALAGGCRR